MAVSLLNYAYDAGFISGEQKKKADNYKAETGASDENVIRDMKLMTEEKLAEVERYFKENAGLFYKAILKVLGKENLKDLIEEALRMVKDNFGK